MVKKPKYQLVILMVLICFPQLSETIYTPSLPDLARDLGVNAKLAQWTLSIYFVGFALGVAYWGQYSDFVGRKKAIRRGIIVYILGCAGCFLSSEIGLLLFFRMIQAFGMSIGSVVVQSILRESYEGKERTTAFAWINLFMAFSPAMGPFLGGYLTVWFGWRSNFLALILIICFIYSAVHFLLIETNSFAGKVKISRSMKNVILEMFVDPRPVCFALLVALFNGIMFSYYSHVPFLFTEYFGLTPSEYGKLGLIPALGVVIGSWISKQLGNRSRNESGILIGCLGAFIAILLLNVHHLWIYSERRSITLNLATFLLPMFLFFVSFSVTMPCLLSGALIRFKKNIGTASSVFGLFYYIFTGFFNFLMGLLDNGTLSCMAWYFLILILLTMVVFFVFNKTESIFLKNILQRS